MTVEVQTKKVTGSGNGSATVFSFSPLTIFDTDELLVTKVDTDGVESVLLEGTTSTTYSVSLTSPNNLPSTGSVTYPASGGTPLASGESIIIKRVLTLEQQTDLENQGGYFPDIQEGQFDKIVMMILQQQEEMDRMLRVAISDDVVSLELPKVDDRAGKLFKWDDDGLPTVIAEGDLSGGGGGVTDHGALTGLTDDDHTQYLLVAGTRAMTGGLDMGGFAITNVGNVDGRDVSVDGTKLDGIESGAEANDVDSVFSRTGAVVAAASDYDASQIDNDSGVSGTFVDDALDTLDAGKASLGQVTINVQTGSHTLVLTDNGKVVQMIVATANDLTVPPNSSVAFPVGTVIGVLSSGAGQTTIVEGVGVTVNTPATLVVRAQHSMVSLIKTDTDVWTVSGDLEASA